MTNIIVAFSKAEDAKSIKNILMRNGFKVIAVCTSGAQVLNSVDGLNGGIVVSGYRFDDMMYEELYECLPPYIQLLLLSSPSNCSAGVSEGIVFLPMPLKVHGLLETLEMLVQAQIRSEKKRKLQPKERSDEEKQVIAQAKALLMKQNHMTELEAHRYIQKCSMDGKTNMVETSRRVLSLTDN